MPTGLERTRPNRFNHEGVLNLEYLKGTDLCTLKHNVTVPFTRMVAGPTDYHLGGFRSINRNKFKHRCAKPFVLGTHCRMLAMYVVCDNPIPMMCNTPDTYKGQPGFDLLCQAPTVWDKTRVLSGRVGEYIIVVRRKVADWYLGAMTDWTLRNLRVPLRFPPQEPYCAEVWADATDSHDPNKLIFHTQTVKASERLQLHLPTGGGQVILFRPLTKRSP